MQKERYIAAIDFGSSKISLSVSTVSEEAVDIAFAESAESEGVKSGMVVNAQKTAAVVKGLVEKAEEQLNITITQVVVNLPRSFVRAQKTTFRTVRSNADAFITSEEIRNLTSMAEKDFDKNLHDDECVYKLLTQSFSLDEQFQVSEDEIKGATGSEFEGHFIAFVGKKKAKNNIDKVFSTLNTISVSRYYFTPAIESRYIVRDEDKEYGTALIEIGGAVTSVSVYYKGVMQYYRSFNFGGSSITSDIQMECSMPVGLSENIKKAFGSCTPNGLATMADKVLQINNPTIGDSSSLPVKYLSEIISSRMKEIAQAALYLVAESGYADKIRSGIILSGGGALLQGCASLFSSMSGLKTRVAFPGYFKTIQDCSQESMILAAAQDEHVICAGHRVADNSGNLFAEQPVEEPPVNQTPVQEKPRIEKPQQPQNSAPKAKDTPKKEKHKGFSGFIGNIFDTFYDNVGETEDDNK